jgi:hypothetical protein
MLAAGQHLSAGRWPWNLPRYPGQPVAPALCTPSLVGGGQVVVAAARHTAPTADVRARSPPPTQTGSAVQGAAVAGPAAAAPAAVPAGAAADGLRGPLPAGSQQPGAVHHAPEQPPSPATGMDVDAGPLDDEVRHAAGACTWHACLLHPTGGPLAPAGRTVLNRHGALCPPRTHITLHAPHCASASSCRRS